MKRIILPAFALVLVLIAVAEPAFAQRRGGGGFRGGGFRGGGGARGGGAHFSRAAARPSISRPAPRPSFSSGGSVARPSAPAVRPSLPAARPSVPAARPSRDIGRPGRPDIGQPGRPDLGRPGRPGIDRPVNRPDIDVDVDWDPDYGCCDHPLAWGAAAFTAGAAAASVGSTYYSLPPSCEVVVVNGITYNECDGIWYQPQFVGTETTYIVVSPPQ